MTHLTRVENGGSIFIEHHQHLGLPRRALPCTRVSSLDKVRNRDWLAAAPASATRALTVLGDDATHHPHKQREMPAKLDELNTHKVPRGRPIDSRRVEEERQRLTERQQPQRVLPGTCGPRVAGGDM